MKDAQIEEIWKWLGTKNNYENGVTNKQVIEKFGETYKDAWKTVKSRFNCENGMFYENGKWCRWHSN